MYWTVTLWSTTLKHKYRSQTASDHYAVAQVLILPFALAPRYVSFRPSLTRMLLCWSTRQLKYHCLSIYCKYVLTSDLIFTEHHHQCFCYVCHFSLWACLRQTPCVRASRVTLVNIKFSNVKEDVQHLNHPLTTDCECLVYTSSYIINSVNIKHPNTFINERPESVEQWEVPGMN